tara:strand:- start:14896 stop:15561 length:666 start_codon:yes stop_codon:yes gene_type:complete
LRLNKIIAKHQNCSRREADNLIKNGLVTVNGNLTTQMGVIVKKDDEIIFKKRKINYNIKYYILLNKPKKYSCFNKNLHTKKLLPKTHVNELNNYEKLDFNETGLTIFSNDAILLKKIKNSSRIKKIYHVKLSEQISDEVLRTIKNHPQVSINKISNVKGNNEIGIELTKGNIKILKNIFQKMSIKIIFIDTVSIGVLSKKNLPRKQNRFLTEKEITILNRS